MGKEVQLPDVFKESFDKIAEDVELLTKQRTEAMKQYPELMLVLDLHGIYNRYLVRSLGGNVTRRPIPNGDLIPIPYPPEIERDIFKELERWSEAVIQAGAEYENSIREVVRTCNIVKREFNAALNCVTRYSQTLPQNQDEWDEFRDCAEDLERLARELERLNCD